MLSEVDAVPVVEFRPLRAIGMFFSTSTSLRSCNRDVLRVGLMAEVQLIHSRLRSALRFERQAGLHNHSWAFRLFRRSALCSSRFPQSFALSPSTRQTVCGTVGARQNQALLFCTTRIGKTCLSHPQCLLPGIFHVVGKPTRWRERG